MSDADLFARARAELFPAALGDVLDTLGAQRQYLPPYVRPIDPGMVVLGRAMTVLEADFITEPGVKGASGVADRPFGLMFRALDDLKPDEVYVAAGASHRYALWGGLMSTRARHCRAAGVVLDGFHRDTTEILELGFPAFSAGAYGQDQGVRGKVVDFRVTLRFGEATIRPGDILFGDRDGVLVVPREVEEEAFAKAFEKARAESQVRRAIEGGMGAGDAFAKFGVM